MVTEAVRTIRQVLAEIWRRAITTQPDPGLRTTLILGLAGFVLVSLRLTWKPVRMLSTMIHEAGHAVTALVSGRRLAGIRLHSDTSGLTLSKGRARGMGMTLTLASGYPAPTVVALGAAVLLHLGYAVGLMWLLVVACGLMLVQIRNLYGLWVILVVGAGLVSVSWWMPPLYLSWLAYLLVWLLMLSGPRPLVELARQRRDGRSRGSDIDQLARITPVPAFGWLAWFWLLTVAGLVAGGWLLMAA